MTRRTVSWETPSMEYHVSVLQDWGIVLQLEEVDHLHLLTTVPRPVVSWHRAFREAQERVRALVREDPLPVDSADL